MRCSFCYLTFNALYRYWALIDTALRTVAVDKNVDVRLLISWWPHSLEEEKVYLRSLVDLSNIHQVNISVVSIGCLIFNVYQEFYFLQFNICQEKLFLSKITTKL